MLLHRELVQQRLLVLLLLLLLSNSEVSQVILYFIFCFLTPLLNEFLRIWTISIQYSVYWMALLKKSKDYNLCLEKGKYSRRKYKGMISGKNLNH